MSDRNHLSQQNIFSEHRHSLLDVLSAFCIIAPILITLYNNGNNNTNNNINNNSNNNNNNNNNNTNNNNNNNNIQ